MYKGYTQAQNKATQKYLKEHMDQIAIRVPKGKRDEYKAFAESQGKSLAALICELIEREIASRS